MIIEIILLSFVVFVVIGVILGCIEAKRSGHLLHFFVMMTVLILFCLADIKGLL